MKANINASRIKITGVSHFQFFAWYPLLSIGILRFSRYGAASAAPPGVGILLFGAEAMWCHDTP